MRAAFLFLLLLPACGLFGLSKEERDQLTLYQSNAQLYYEGARFDQALASTRRGLQLAPDDYKLLSIRAWCYLRRSENDPGQLLRAEAAFDEVFALRSLGNHDHTVLLGRGITQQRLGVAHRRQKERLLAEAEGRDLTDAERELRRLRANEHTVQAGFAWQEAERLFQALLDREELLRIANLHLMELAIERGNYTAAVGYADACLARNAAEQEVKQAIIRETMSLAYERQTRNELKQLVEQEKLVRVAVAEMHYRTEHYELAAEQLTILLNLDPTRSNDYYNRARAYEALGRIEDARRDLEKFLAATKLPAGDKRVLYAVQFTQSN
jgi:tetratricopeptide (TPR) repeat protein